MTFDAVGAAWFVLDTSLRALAAALAVALVLRLLRVRAASVLHSAWSAVLFAMLLMPVLRSIVPALPVPVPAAAVDFFDARPGTEEPSPAVVAQSTPVRDGINAVPSPLLHDSRRSSDRQAASDIGARGSRSWLPLCVAHPVRCRRPSVCRATVVRLAPGIGHGPARDSPRSDWHGRRASGVRIARGDGPDDRGCDPSRHRPAD